MDADHTGDRGVAAGAAEVWVGGALISEPSQWRQDAVASHWCGLALSDRDGHPRRPRDLWAVLVAVTFDVARRKNRCGESFCAV